MAPVPGPLEEDAFALVDDLVRPHLKPLVDANAPAALGPTGSITLLLQQSLATLEVASTIELEEAFIDDMEGVRDAVSVSMGIERWRLTSIPAPFGTQAYTDLEASNAELHWYSPPASVKEKDLKPTLTEAEGANNSRQVLALSIPRRPITQTDPNRRLWAGLTHPLDVNGLDLTRAQFIDHIPAVLDAFEWRLSAELTTEHARAREEQKESAAEHGLHRWQQGYNQPETMCEWGHLHLCLLEELESFQALNPGIDPDAMRA